MNVLYHYTAAYHLQAILNSGYLKLTESNLKEYVEMYKPVVWLTTQKEPEPYSLGLSGSFLDKTEIRIHVKRKPTPTIKTWEQFSTKNKMNPEFKSSFSEGRKPETWFISTKEIPLKDILLIENRYTKEIYYQNEM